jgi:hypothetical protein
MGQASRAKANRRGAGRAQIAAHRQMVRDLAADTDRLHKQFLGDAEAVRLVAAHRPAQEARLKAARWVNRDTGAQDGLGVWDQRWQKMRLIHSVMRRVDGHVWAHVSVSIKGGTVMPTWHEIRDVNWLFYPDQAGIVVIAPQAEHVSDNEVHHVWTNLTGPSCPDFRILGTI